MKFQYSEKKVKLPGNVHAYAEKKAEMIYNLTMAELLDDEDTIED